MTDLPYWRYVFTERIFGTPYENAQTSQSFA